MLALVALAAQAADPDTDALLARLARPPPDTTTFVEVRYSALVAAPLVASGELEHREDGALVRRVTSPYRETTVLRGENVLLQREGSRPRSFSLDRAPELRGMLASFGALLTGDRAMLDRYFSTTMRGSDASWGWGMPCYAPGRWSATSHLWWPWATRSSASMPSRTSSAG